MYPEKPGFSSGYYIFEVVFIVCGIIQAGAGITCLILIPDTVLQTTSNIWIGILNVIFASVLISIAAHAKVWLTLFFHIAIVVLNLTNILIMELYERRAVLNMEELNEVIPGGSISFLIAVYWSATMASILGFVAGFLASQFICCSAMTAPRKSDANATTGLSVGMQILERTSFQWVFDEANDPRRSSWRSDPSLRRSSRESYASSSWIDDQDQETATILQEPHESEQEDILEPLPVGCVLGSGSSSCCPKLISDIDEEDCDSWRSRRFSKERNDVSLEPLLSKVGAVDVDEMVDTNNVPDRDQTANVSSRKVDLQPNPGEPQSDDDRDVVRRTSEVLAPVRRKSTVPPLPAVGEEQRFPHPHSAFVSTEFDSLINLSNLELLAHQWHFQCQHKALSRRVSLRLAAETAGSTKRPVFQKV